MGVRKINLAKHAGFCFGVKRAIKIAQEMAKSRYRIEMLHEIVHNEQVVKDIEKLGLRKVKRLRKGKNKALLVQAHGMPKNIIKKAKDLGYKIIDATCPMVYEIHKIAMSMEKKNRKIIIIGDKNHIEGKGIAGNIKSKPLIVESEKDIPIDKIKRMQKGAVVVQSTQNVQKVENIIGVLKKNIKDLNAFNTICAITRKKQKEIQTMPLDNDIMIIVGSKKSANTKRLYEISKSLNKHTYWVESPKDLRNVWFKEVLNKEVLNIGVTSGASTPDYLTQDVIGRIKELTKYL